LFQEIGVGAVRVDALANLGNVYLALSETDRTFEFYEQPLTKGMGK
jgi:hypothetical protein